MYPVNKPLFTIYLATAILTGGNGLLGTLVGMRASAENFPIQTIGLVMSCYFIGFVIGSFAWSRIITHFGYTRAFAIIATTAATTAILYVLIIDPIAWGGFRVASGFCAAGWCTILESWLNINTPREYRGASLSIYISISMLSIAMGQFLIIIGDINRFESFAIASILFSVSFIPVVMVKFSEPQRIKTPKLDIGILFEKVPLGIAGALVAGIIGGAFWGMAPVFANAVGMRPFDVALFMFVTAIGGGFFQIPIGRYSDRFDRRKVLFFVCFFGAIFMLFSFALSKLWLSALFFFSFFWGGPVFSVYAISVAHVNDYLDPNEVVGATGGLLLINGIGSGIGPVLAGYLMHRFGPSSLFLLMSLLLSVLGVYSYYRISRRAPVPSELQAEYIPMLRTSPLALEMDPRIPDQDENSDS